MEIFTIEKKFMELFYLMPIINGKILIKILLILVKKIFNLKKNYFINIGNNILIVINYFFQLFFQN